jgi:hypothetical protein
MKLSFSNLALMKECLVAGYEKLPNKCSEIIGLISKIDSEIESRNNTRSHYFKMLTEHYGD